MKDYDKPFDYDLYKKYDGPGKMKVMELIEKYNIDTNVIDVPETPKDPKPDLKGDLFYHEVGVAKYQWKNSNILPDKLTIISRKVKYFIHNPIFWTVSGDLEASVWITTEELYNNDIKIVKKSSSKTKAGFEYWIIIPKKYYKERVLR